MITVNNLTIIATDATYAIAVTFTEELITTILSIGTFQSSTTGTTTVLGAFCLNGSATAASASVIAAKIP